MMQNNDINNLIEDYSDNFDYQIKARGKDYYESNKVLNVIKCKNIFKAKVSGTNDMIYNVNLSVENEDFLDYYCDCPCEFPCKHIYATMLAIIDKSYNEVELKEEIKENKYTLQSIIEKIPDKEIKEYLLSDHGKDSVCFEMKAFEKYFCQYMPIQSYEFYYNNIYNSLVIDNYFPDIITTYLDKIKLMIPAQKYRESYDICKAIIEAFHDTGNINKSEELIETFPLLGMNLRIIYRKSSKELRKEINTWINKLEKSGYYDNVYLEDLILLIK